MRKLPVESDTNRYQNKDVIYQQDDKNKKNYKTILVKILKILAVIAVLIIIAAILIYIFVLKKKAEDCKDGFFHPEDEDSKSSCYQCTLFNCKICKGKINNDICTQCKDEYNPQYNDKNEIIECGLQGDISKNGSNIEENISCCEKCLECDKTKKICSKCAAGYFVPDDSDNKLICSPCSLKHCQSCHGKKDSDVCDLCDSDYEAELENNIIKLCKNKETKTINCEIGEGDKCLTCSETENNKCASCNPLYKLVDGKCELEVTEGDIELTEEKNKEEVEIKPTEEINNKEEENKTTVEINKKDEENKTTEEINKKDEENKTTEEINKKDEENKTTEEINKKDEENKTTEEVNKKDEETKLTEEVNKKDEETKLTEVVSQQDDDEEEDLVLDYDYILVTAKYAAKKTNTKTPIVFPEKNIYVKRMKVDGILLNSTSVDDNGYYLFENNSVDHTVKMWLELNSSILENLFPLNNYLKEVKFNKVKNDKKISVTSMENMFYNCSNLTSVDISALDTKYVTSMKLTFYNCYSLKSMDFSKNNFENLRTAYKIFNACHSLTSINLGTPFPNLENLEHAFYYANSIKSLDLSKMNLGKIKYIYGLFRDCHSLEYVNLKNMKTDLVEDMRTVFYKDIKLTSVDLSGFNTKKVNDTRWMFFNCISLTYLDLSSFDTSEVTDMREMFYNCSSLTSLNFGNNFNTGKVANMSFLFAYCSNLTNLDVSKFDTHNVKNMYCMFYSCKKIKSIDVSSFDTSKVTTFVFMFTYCSSLTSLDLSHFNMTESDKHYYGPPILFYCSSLKFIDITPVSVIFKDFFTGVPKSGGYIRISKRLQIYLSQTLINVLPDWEWEIVNT